MINPNAAEADAAFRAEVRAFLAAALTDEMATAPRTTQMLSIDLQQRWHRLLAAKGWAAPSWPTEHGGAGWTSRWRKIFEEEMAAAEAPPLSVFLEMIGPVLCAYGTPAQQAEHIPPLLAGERLWCQGYSEPGSGSDLASLKTRAVRDGDHYVVDGQKIWTSFAQHADWMFALVRTSSEGRPQDGISFLLVDMRSPGITLRPIVSIDGLHHLNEVFFEGLRVPVCNLIGEENQGWRISKFLLEHERSSVGSLVTVQGQVQALRDAVADQAPGAGLETAIAEVEIELATLEALTQRQGQLAERGEGHPSTASMLKLRTTELQQRIAELTIEAYGPWFGPDQSALLEPYRPQAMIGPPGAARAALFYLFGRAFTILGGSSEIQHEIIFRQINARAS
ncbi:MAG: Isovaleryl-CoA dehydrogenase [Caulobacter sp.]|jgi:alkylation response protein AidB-like acyl-CoA dehydrogenase|nr:Isovaleryl-CoA dehydrogenase [Caulobacter sp.]